MLFDFYLHRIEEYINDENKAVDFDMSAIQYNSMPNSIWYVWLLLLGDYSYDTYEYGNGAQLYQLNLLFVCTAFIIQIHLLNMLIAIMGNTFAERNEIVHQIKIKDKLLFIVENWYLVGLALGGSDKMKYIITACITKTEDEDFQMLVALKN